MRHYDTFGGDEYFISYETEDESKIFGFLRLRLRHSDSMKEQPSDNHDEECAEEKSLRLDVDFPELVGCGLIRELHVYGLLVGSHEQKSESDARYTEGL